MTISGIWAVLPYSVWFCQRILSGSGTETIHSYYLYDLMVMADEEYNDDLIKRITDNIIDRYLKYADGSSKIVK